jgi:hypothetical protein
METDYRTLCRIVVSCTKGIDDMKMRRSFLSYPTIGTWCICNVDMCNFCALHDEIALQFENLAFGRELEQCTELFAWLLPFASCILTWKKFTM